MKKFSSVPLLVAMVGVGIVATGCKREAPAPAAAPEAVAQVVAAPAAGTVIVELAGSDDRMQVTSSGEKSDGKIKATGVGGALVFGPYIALVPGKYSLLIEGGGTGQFNVDVVHAAGTKQVAAQGYTGPAAAAAGNGSLATLDFEVSEPIDGVEFRVIVPDGADTVVSSYKVVAR